MYRILIVDDESIERRGLRKIISDYFSSTIIVEEADNGRNAILKAEEFRPDVIFMDIKMPGIDGIEAVKEIKKSNQGIQIIMVTAFDTFEYARQVMRLGVKDYILKPSTKEEVIEPLVEIFKKIELEKLKRTEEIILKDNYRRALSIVQSRVITSMLIGSPATQSTVELELEWEQSFQKQSFVIVFEIRNQGFTQEDKEDKEVISFLMAELGYRFRKHFVGERNLERIPVLVQISEKEEIDEATVRKETLKCGEEIIKKVLRNFPTYEISIGIGRLYNEVEQFVQSYHEALSALMSAKHPNTCHYFDEHLFDESDLDYPFILEKKVLEAIISGLVDEVFMKIRGYMETLISYCQMNKMVFEEKLTEFFVLLSRQVADSGIKIVIERNFPETETIEQLKEYAIEEINRITKQIYSITYLSYNKDLIHSAKEYISKNYQKTLTLEEVAENVQLSPQYFSKIFKERCGSSFIDYLTEVRVEKAKELIRTKERSVKEVCYEVGYKDPNYFSRVFKKYTGVSPSDYQHSFQ